MSSLPVVTGVGFSSIYAKLFSIIPRSSVTLAERSTWSGQGTHMHAFMDHFSLGNYQCDYKLHP